MARNPSIPLSLGQRSWRALFFLLLLCAPVPSSAASGPGLAVGESGATLYQRQDIHSEKIASLRAGEPVTLLAEAVGATRWYMVQTRQNLVGWVLASELVVNGSWSEGFREAQESTWSAITGNGRVYEGTYTIQHEPASGEASGGWTLHDKSGRIVARGTWSARKFSTGWNGTWRASVDGRPGERTGSWTADLRLPPPARFEALFERAAREAVRGIWASGRQSGSWSIRAGK